MTKRVLCSLAGVLAALALASPASAAFEMQSFDVRFEIEDGSTATQAGLHPDVMRTTFEVTTEEELSGAIFPQGAAKILDIAQVPGLAGVPSAVPACSTLDFLTLLSGSANVPECADSSAVGWAEIRLGNETGSGLFPTPIYSLRPPPGVAAALGFWVLGVPTTIELGVKPTPPYNIIAKTRNISQGLEFLGADFTLWGNPASPEHDEERGACYNGLKACPAKVPEVPFIVMPRACEGPLPTAWEMVSWQNPTDWISGFAETHDDFGNPRGMVGCGTLGFEPRIDAAPTNESAAGPTGLDFAVEIEDEGLLNPEGIAHSDVKKAVVTLPEGMTVNPSVAEGLATCSVSGFERESVKSAPGEGCPEASKLGSVEVRTPLLKGETLAGSVFVATQDDPATSAKGAENPFDSLIALYMTIRHRDLGVIVKLAGRVEPDPKTGQLITTFGEPGHELPQFPFSEFRFRFREGGRSPLITPPACGAYEAKAVFTPWANPTASLTTTSEFQVSSGVNGGPCPSGGVPPFEPGFQAGSLNNNAGSFSPFTMRLTRRDGDQDLTKFSSVLPPGVLGSLKGIGKCSDGALELARSKTGRQELASPSCPANSEIGRSLAGAGVGEALTYVGGKVYLAGPYKGRPLSVIAITPAVAGPFDAGTVALRLALTLNPRTAEVEVDGAASDPIPHILQGIPLKVREIRVYVDRPNFILNPTSCDESSVKATLFGSYLDVFSPDDDVPVDLATRYQAASCASLAFRPKLAIKLKGGTKRGGFPGLKAHYRPRSGDANLKGLVVRLPRSAFLEQGHIRTICTRVQFAAKACPKGARYGYIKAWTPLLDEPLQGPVYLRSSNHKLPDLVFDLHGLVDVEVATRIDSVKGGIRARVEDAPDAPISRVILNMQGGKKGLIVNSRNLCHKRGRNRAAVRMEGHNGRRAGAKPVMRVKCGNKRKKHKRHHR